MKYVRPRLILFAYMTGTIIFISASIGTNGNTRIAVLNLVLFFESIVFPTIFTLSMRGLGRHTKRGASFLVASVSGGAVFPVATGAVVDARDTRTAMAVPLAGFLIAYSFPIYLNLFKAKELDAFNETKIGIVDENEKAGSGTVEQFSGKDAEAGRIERVGSRE
jgi:FHS family L-fucose permease-like MFS transporter